jgi:hypothetical protein
LDELSNDKEAFNPYLRALKHGEQGQQKLASGDSAGAIHESKKAEGLFRRVPVARSPLGYAGRTWP